MQDIELYINKSKTFIDFMLSQQQWSGLSKSDIDSWLNNFHDQPLERQALVYRLLTNIIYFSEKDIVDALRKGVFRCLSYDNILAVQKENDFKHSSHSLSKAHEKNVSQACFVPLLDSNSPHESGNSMSRVLVQQGIISPAQSVFIKDAPKLLKQEYYKSLVIVDDCVGSGNQLSDFWFKTVIEDDGKTVSILDICKKYNVTAYYLTLFGYSDSIDTIRQKCDGLKIYCVRELSEQHRVFSDSSYMWKDAEQRKEAYDFFKEISRNVGICVKGYKGFDFALVMHNTIPNWSLPILWKETADWNVLLRRKNS